VVPVRSVNTGPNPRYFGQGRGVTYLNYTSDQFTGLGGLVIIRNRFVKGYANTSCLAIGTSLAVTVAVATC
jgi:hypothetical protein